MEPSKKPEAFSPYKGTEKLDNPSLAPQNTDWQPLLSSITDKKKGVKRQSSRINNKLKAAKTAVSDVTKNATKNKPEIDYTNPLSVSNFNKETVQKDEVGPSGVATPVVGSGSCGGGSPGGADCCPDIGCANTGGCSYPIEEENKCNIYCYIEFMVFGTSPGGCVDGCNYTCEYCDDGLCKPSPNAPCFCPHVTLGECQVCNNDGYTSLAPHCRSVDYVLDKIEPQCLCVESPCGSDTVTIEFTPSTVGSIEAYTLDNIPPGRNWCGTIFSSTEDKGFAIYGKPATECRDTVTNQTCDPDIDNRECVCTEVCSGPPVVTLVKVINGIKQKVKGPCSEFKATCTDTYDNQECETVTECNGDCDCPIGKTCDEGICV